MRLTRPVSTLPAPISTSRVTPARGHGGDAFAPAHRAGDLLDQPAADFGRVGDRRGQHIGDERHGGRRDRDTGERLAIAVGGRLHQRAMEGRGHRQQHGALGALGLGDLERPLDRGLVPEITTWPGALSLAAWQTSPSRGLGGDGGGLGRSRGRAAPPWRPCRPASPACIAWPRMRSSRAVSARPSAPAAASAEYSPSEWPATKAASRREVQPGLGLQHADGGKRDGHERRLGILGQRQIGLGPLPHDRA